MKIHEMMNNKGRDASCWSEIFLLEENAGGWIRHPYISKTRIVDGWNLGNFNRKSLLGVDEQRFSPTISIMNERQAIW